MAAAAGHNKKGEDKKMAVSRSEFAIKTLMFCLILFSLTILASTLALSARDSLDQYNTDDLDLDPYGTGARKDNESESDYDISDTFNRVAEIFTLYTLPMPFPIIFTIWNIVLLSLILYCVAEIIRAWIPFMPSG